MASTIITKNGTGSAVPTSLQQGELAINVTNGGLYYGTSGSSNSVSSSFIFTELSASNIVTHRNITASKNISASGNITGSILYATSTVGMYADKIRRASDSSNTTKILLNDEVLKFHVSDSSNETLKIQESSSVFTGNITASGNINANTFKGVPIVLGRNSQMIAQPALGDFYYGNNSQGFFHHQHNAKLTSATPVGQTLGGGSQHNGFILPCDVKNVELRASCRTNIDNTGFSFWVLKNTRASKGSSNSALVFMASASISGSNVGTQDNRFHTCDISGSSHSYITNMTASEGEALFVILQIHDETGGDGGASQSNTNTKFYYTLSARTNE